MCAELKKNKNPQGCFFHLVSLLKDGKKLTNSNYKTQRKYLRQAVLPTILSLKAPCTEECPFIVQMLLAANELKLNFN